jgi:hypothetical protein
MIIGRLLTEGNFLTLLSPDQVALQIRSGLLAQIGAPWSTAAAWWASRPGAAGAPPPPSASFSMVWSRPRR